MIYFLAVLISLITLGLNNHLQLWHGEAVLIPTFLLLCASEGAWRSWLIWLATFGLVGYFTDLSFVFLILLVVTSVIAYYIFERWIDREHPIARTITLCIFLGILLAVFYTATVGHIAWAPMGSTLISLPIIWLWYSWSPLRKS